LVNLFESYDDARTCKRLIQTLCDLTFSGMEVRTSFSLQNTASYV